MAGSSASFLASCTENHSVKAMISITVLLFLATIMIAIRFYVRLRILHGATGWDDYFILGSLVSGGASFGCYVKLFTTGMGRRIYCLSFQQVLDITKWSVLSQIFVSTTLDLSKISICLFVLRVVDKARKGIAKSIWLLLFCIALTHMLQVTLFLVQCRPLSALWSTKVKGRCFSTEIVYTIAYLNYGTGCFTDLVCIGIVIYIIRQLKMKRQTKIALCGLISLGVFTAACLAIAAAKLRGVFESDYSWGIVEPSMWAGHSAFVDMITASLPPLRPIFKFIPSEKFTELFTRLLHSASRSRSRSYFSKPGFRNLSNDENNSSKGQNDMNTPKAKQSKQNPNSIPLSVLPRNSVLVTTSIGQSIGLDRREDLELDSLVTEINGNK